MPAYDEFFIFAVIRPCTSAASREFVAREFRGRYRKHTFVGVRSLRREILCMQKNYLRMPTYGPYAASVPRVCSRHNLHQFHDEPSGCWHRVLNIYKHPVCVFSSYTFTHIVILWVYYTIPFGLSLIWHFRGIIFQHFELLYLAKDH